MEKKLKIAVICDVLGESNNGTVLAALNLINYLKQQGHTVYVVSPDPTTEGKPDYYVVPTMNLGKFLNGILKKNGVSLALSDDIQLKEVIQKSDAVHIQLPFLLGRHALKIALELKKPVTASFHCQAENITAHFGAMNNNFANRTVYKNFYSKFYRYVDAIHYPTEFIKQVFCDNTKIDKPSYVISNGVNDSFFSAADKPTFRNEKFTIICSGRYSKEKSQSTLIKAVAKSKYKNNIKLLFAGTGPLKNRLERLAKRKHVDCTFKFYSRDELIDVLRSSDLYIHTAVIEIEAIACMEALATGLVAIIADSKRSATRFFAVDKKTLFKYNSPKDLCNKIEYFYENRNAIETYKQKYKSVSVSFDQQDCMHKMEQMIIENMQKKQINEK